MSVIPLAQDDPDDNIWAKGDGPVLPRLTFHYTYRQRGKAGQRRVYKPYQRNAGAPHNQHLTHQMLHAMDYVFEHGNCSGDTFQQAVIMDYMEVHPEADKARVANKLASRLSELCAMGPHQRPDLRIMEVVGLDKTGQNLYGLTSFGTLIRRRAHARQGWHDDERLWETW